MSGSHTVISLLRYGISKCTLCLHVHINRSGTVEGQIILTLSYIGIIPLCRERIVGDPIGIRRTYSYSNSAGE